MFYLILGFFSSFVVRNVHLHILCEVEYYDLEGNMKNEVFEGFKATVFSHEYDHLEGVLHLDKTDEVKMMTWEEMKIYREEHPYEIIEK